MKAKVVGAGSIGSHLSHALRQLGHGVVLCDVDPQALERTRQQVYPGRYGRWDPEIELALVHEAKRGGFDLIVIGTPPESHVQLALEALDENPRAILVEKPVCTPALEGAAALLTKAQAQGCQVFVGYNHVVGAAMTRACDLIDGGGIGEVVTLDVEFREHWGGILAAHPWLAGPADSYLGYWRRGGGAAAEHSHAINLWQYISDRLGAKRIKEVNATLDYVAQDGMEYDRLCLLNAVTDGGLVGRVAQDVVTGPARKWARVQGTRGFIEWHCGYQPGHDAVITNIDSETPDLELFATKRSDDFLLEMKHVVAVMAGELPHRELTIERGLDTMMVVAAAHHSAQLRRPVTIDWSQGYGTAALRS